MILRGRVWKFGDNVSTDHITPGRYFHLRSNIEELAKHIMEDADPNFMNKFRPGDLIAAGRNFGCGSSREHAPLALKVAGVSAVLAKSFARIFFRNAINVGLPVLIVDTDGINEGDYLEVDLLRGIVRDVTKNLELRAKPLPDFTLKILECGGLVEYIKKYGDFIH